MQVSSRKLKYNYEYSTLIKFEIKELFKNIRLPYKKCHNVDWERTNRVL